MAGHAPGGGPSFSSAEVVPAKDVVPGKKDAPTTTVQGLPLTETEKAPVGHDPPSISPHDKTHGHVATPLVLKRMRGRRALRHASFDRPAELDLQIIPDDGSVAAAPSAPKQLQKGLVSRAWPKKHHNRVAEDKSQPRRVDSSSSPMLSFTWNELPLRVMQQDDESPGAQDLGNDGQIANRMTPANPRSVVEPAAVNRNSARPDDEALLHKAGEWAEADVVFPTTDTTALLKPVNLSGTFAGASLSIAKGLGDLTFTILDSADHVTGTWRSEQGRTGRLTGTVKGTTIIRLRLEQSVPCAGVYTGVVAVVQEGTRLNGLYAGSDCEGNIDGSFVALKR